MTETHVPSGCCVRLIDLPVTVGAMVAFDEDGFASIYLNARLSHEKQRKALRHELRHIDNDDAYNPCSIQAAEKRADGVQEVQTLPPMIRASDMQPTPYIPKDVIRDMATLKRLGILTDNWQNDPLLNLPDYDYY